MVKRKKSKKRAKRRSKKKQAKVEPVFVPKKESFHHLFFAVAAVVVFVDQMLKYFVTSGMSVGESIGNNIFSITLARNTGTAFGLFSGNNTVFIFVTIAIIIGIIVFYLKETNTFLSAASFSLVLGGAVGNLFDRILFGYVADFIRISVWPAFNIADSAITVGVIGLIVYYWKK